MGRMKQTVLMRAIIKLKPLIYDGSERHLGRSSFVFALRDGISIIQFAST